MLELRNLHFSYDGEELLAGVDLEVANGESVFLLGPSGSGKSTILRCAAGLEAPTIGSVHLNDADVTSIPPHRRRIGLMFQEPALFPHLTVLENVAFGIQYRDHAPPEPMDSARDFLALVNLEAKASARVHDLSGGERQRIALARTLAAKPRAVLLDEPLSALDRPLREGLGLQIKELLEQANVPALWVTHDEQEAARLGDRTLALRGGHLVAPELKD